MNEYGILSAEFLEGLYGLTSAALDEDYQRISQLLAELLAMYREALLSGALNA
jgi:hypothetical protein